MTTDPTAAVWIDGDPLMEAIAAAVWEQCGRSDSGACVEDDPRNIAAVAATVARAAASAVVAPPTDRAARDRIRLALATADGVHFDDLEPHDYQRHVDMLLAVLPEPTDRAAEEPRLALTAAIYDALVTFQRTARLASLQHAQMRQHLAEHLTDALALRMGVEPTPETVRAAALLEGAVALEALDPVEAALAGQHAWVDAANVLRRLAVEAHDTGTQQQGDRGAVLMEAADALPDADLPFVSPMGRRQTADWLRRLAVEAQQPDGRCPACGHTVCDGDGPCGARSGDDFCTCPGPAPVAQQPAALRGELKPWQLLADQPDEPLPQTERVIGGRRLATAEQQAAAADGEETQP